MIYYLWKIKALLSKTVVVFFLLQAVSPDGPKLKFHTEQYEI